MTRLFTRLGMFAMCLLLAVTANAEVEDYSKSLKPYRESPEVAPFFNNSYGYAVFPVVGKGAFGLGVAHGQGQVYRGGQVSGFTNVTQISLGFQVGGQAFSQIIFFKDKRAYDDFTNGNFEFDAEASAVAITAGAQAKATTVGATASASGTPSSPSAQAKARYRKGMAVFVHTKGGFMYAAAIGGQKFNYNPL